MLNFFGLLHILNSPNENPLRTFSFSEPFLILSKNLTALSYFKCFAEKGKITDWKLNTSYIIHSYK